MKNTIESLFRNADPVVAEILNKALSEKEISVTDLAFEVGYENISYFIKEFKNKTGISPKQYMLAQHRNKLRH